MLFLKRELVGMWQAKLLEVASRPRQIMTKHDLAKAGQISRTK
jgi:hypothetical protein